MMKNEGDWQTSLKTFQNMQKQDMVIDTISYKVLIDMLWNAGEWKKALEILEKMQDKGLQSNTKICNILIEWRKALKILEKIQNNDAKSDIVLDNALNNILRNLSKLGQWKMVLEIFQNMQK